MRNIIFFLCICFIILSAIVVGTQRSTIPVKKPSVETAHASRIPTIGRIEVLNGCGISGAAGVVADFLRDNGFDVKNIDNATSWNYPHTIVVSRTKDMTIAQQICTALHTDRCICIRTGDEFYNVSVFVGSDFGALVQ